LAVGLFHSACPRPNGYLPRVVNRSDELPLMIDKIPTLAWSCRPDGFAHDKLDRERAHESSENHKGAKP
jgi:hypothetical protein